jgi:hypothetical protein
MPQQSIVQQCINSGTTTVRSNDLSIIHIFPWKVRDIPTRVGPVESLFWDSVLSLSPGKLARG